MRLFVAVDLDDTVRRAAGRVARNVRDTLERAEMYGVSWVAPDNFHLTLRFLGEVADEVALRVQEVLAPPFAVAPFDVALGGVGVFPPAGAARVIWLGVHEGLEELTSLHREVEERLAPLAFAPDERAYRAHLTVARFRVPAPARVRQLIAAGEAPSIGRCPVSHLTLYRSRLSPKGATYTALVRSALGGAHR
ncbi:MAG: RNA 2',3'-cyclic phosphodiesterase [Bacteroidales bacterium]